MKYFVYPYSILSIDLYKLDHTEWTIISLKNNEKAYTSCLPNDFRTRVVFLEDLQPARLFDYFKHQSNIEEISTLDEKQIFGISVLNDYFTQNVSSSLISLFFTDKYWMRTVLGNNILQPPFSIVRDINDVNRFVDQFGKSVLKPRRNDSSKGITIVETKQDIKNLDLLNGSYMIEKFIDSQRMITVDGYTIDSSIQRLLFHEYDGGVLNTLKENSALITRTSGLYFEKNGFSVIKNLKKIILTIISSLNLKSDSLLPFHFEFFLCDNKIFFCEVGRRFGGGGIMRLGVEEFGVDLLDEYWLRLKDKSIPKVTKDVTPMYPKVISAWYKKYVQPGLAVNVPDFSELKIPFVLRTKNNILIGKSYDKANDITSFSFTIQFNSINEVNYRKNICEIKFFSNKYQFKGKKDEL